MTTPHQGPGMWQQGNREQALDWLANLDAGQQQALKRSIRMHQAAGPIFNAVNRVIQTAQRTAARLSDYAQRLASSAQNQLNRAGQYGERQVNRAVEFGERQVNRAAEFGERQVNRAAEFGERQVNRAAEFGQDKVAQVTEMGQRGMDRARDGAEWTAAAAAGVAHRGIDAGKQAINAGQNVVGKVSRWFKEKQSNTSIRANAARAAFQAFRTDPALQNTVSPKDVKVLSEQAAAIGTAKNWDELNAAIQKFGQSADERLGTPGAQASTDKANPAWALQGTTDPRGAVNQTPAAKAADPQGQQNQGEAAKTTGGKHRAGPESER